MRRDWGTLSPKPPGIFRFSLAPAEGSKPGGPDGPPGLLRFARLQSALGSLPSVALPSVEQKASEFLFPVSISLGVCRAGNGKRWLWESSLQFVAFGCSSHQAPLGQLSQGTTEGGSSHAAEFAQVLNRSGLIHVGQNLEHSFHGRSFRFRARRGRGAAGR